MKNPEIIEISKSKAIDIAMKKWGKFCNIKRFKFDSYCRFFLIHHWRKKEQKNFIAKLGKLQYGIINLQDENRIIMSNIDSHFRDMSPEKVQFD
jgi:hypothetical protein